MAKKIPVKFDFPTYDCFIVLDDNQLHIEDQFGNPQPIITRQIGVELGSEKAGGTVHENAYINVVRKALIKHMVKEV